MSKWDDLKLQEFLSFHPKMRLAEFGGHVVIEGDYDLDAEMEGFEAIHDSFKIKISFTATYPRDLPTVIETDSFIPRVSDYHTYSDGSFCLGSDIKLKSILHDFPTVPDFADRILNPFLYAVSYKIRHGIYPFGELDHGEKGLIDDYQSLFGVEGKEAVLTVLTALGNRKRVANKLRCPCGCGQRLGRCGYRVGLQKYRRIAKRRWFRTHFSKFTPVEKPKKNKSDQRQEIHDIAA
jgi:hypothetical protein